MDPSTPARQMTVTWSKKTRTDGRQASMPMVMLLMPQMRPVVIKGHLGRESQGGGTTAMRTGITLHAGLFGQSVLVFLDHVYGHLLAGVDGSMGGWPYLLQPVLSQSFGRHRTHSFRLVIRSMSSHPSQAIARLEPLIPHVGLQQLADAALSLKILTCATANLTLATSVGSVLSSLHQLSIKPSTCFLRIRPGNTSLLAARSIWLLGLMPSIVEVQHWLLKFFRTQYPTSPSLLTWCHSSFIVLNIAGLTGTVSI